MLLIAIALVACIIAFLLYYVCVVKAPKSGSPPHPGWLPLVGSLLHIQDNQAVQLHKQFGGKPVVAVYYGLEPVFVLNNFEAFNEAMVKQGNNFVGRPVRVLQKSTFGGDGGIVGTEGELWREYRRFSLKTLRDFGFGRQGGEEIILQEANELCEVINATPVGQGLDTSVLISSAVSNVICQLIFGSRVATEDPRFPRLLDLFKNLTQTKSARHLNLLLTSQHKHFERFSFLLQMTMLRSSRRRVIEVSKQLVDFCKEQVEKHKKEVDLAAEPSDYIEAHLQHQVSAGSSSVFNDLRLALAIRDLFVAGTDTTSNTLRWGIVYMIENPDVAEKVYEEIRAYVGPDRIATSKDKTSMHYTQAVIEEIQRLGTLVPLGVAHRSIDDSIICGYRIPGDSVIVPNIYAIHRDPTEFPDPEKFKPERFLDSKGHFNPHDHVVPFGSGKRACLGESLARMELFIFFTRLMQRYRFKLDPSDGRSLEEIKENEESYGAGIRAPAGHKIVFMPR